MKVPLTASVISHSLLFACKAGINEDDQREQARRDGDVAAKNAVKRMMEEDSEDERLENSPFRGNSHESHLANTDFAIEVIDVLETLAH